MILYDICMILYDFVQKSYELSSHSEDDVVEIGSNDVKHTLGVEMAPMM